jgi:hypothetical protein
MSKLTEIAALLALALGVLAVSGPAINIDIDIDATPQQEEAK